MQLTFTTAVDNGGSIKQAICDTALLRHKQVLRIFYTETSSNPTSRNFVNILTFQH
jgi:hypothetical protein